MDTFDVIDVIDRIKMMMQQKNISNSELAQRCGWHVSKVTKILKGDQKVSMDDLIEIGLALNTNPALLISPDMHDVIDTRMDVMELNTCFYEVGRSASCMDSERIVQIVENELPRTMVKYLSLADTSKKVNVVLRRKRMASAKSFGDFGSEFSPYARVVVTDDTDGQLFRNQLTIGYWFAEDWKDVYLAINYTTFASRKASGTLASIKDMREWFWAMLDGAVPINDKMFITRDGKKRDTFYEAGMIYAKRYSLTDYSEESQLKKDLQDIYSLYLSLLDVATDRVLRTYVNLYQDKLRSIRNEVVHGVNQKNLDMAGLEKIMPVESKKKVIYKGNIKKRKLVLEKNSFKCEVDPMHETFVAKSNDRPYMEIHMLVPLKFQDEYKTSLDVIENCCCLCPNCHAKLTYGSDAERQEMLMGLYLKHKQGLAELGIEVTPMQLFKYYGMD